MEPKTQIASLNNNQPVRRDSGRADDARATSPPTRGRPDRTVDYGKPAEEIPRSGPEGKVAQRVRNHDALPRERSEIVPRLLRMTSDAEQIAAMLEAKGLSRRAGHPVSFEAIDAAWNARDEEALELLSR